MMKLPDKPVSTRKRPKREPGCLPQNRDLEKLPKVPGPEPEQKAERRVSIYVNLQLTGNIQRCILALGTVMGILLTAFGFR